MRETSQGVGWLPGALCTCSGPDGSWHTRISCRAMNPRYSMSGPHFQTSNSPRPKNTNAVCFTFARGLGAVVEYMPCQLAVCGHLVHRTLFLGRGGCFWVRSQKGDITRGFAEIGPPNFLGCSIVLPIPGPGFWGRRWLGCGRKASSNGSTSGPRLLGPSHGQFGSGLSF